jgi:hypothetical protein
MTNDQTMKLIPLGDTDDKAEFYKGTRFKIFNAGLNVKNQSDDFYEYMLCEISGDRNYMQLINITGYKSGAVLAHVKTKDDKTKLVVTGKAIKFSIGTDNTFLLEETELTS